MIPQAVNKNRPAAETGSRPPYILSVRSATADSPTVRAGEEDCDGGHRIEPRSGSIIAAAVDRFVALCAHLPYALVGFGLRLVIAAPFFLSGQTMIEGPAVPLDWLGSGSRFAVVLPTGIKDATFESFATSHAGLPIPPAAAAYLFSYAQFVLPICLVFGFATRISALLLLGLTALIAIYVMPGALWSTYVYWTAILLVLVSLGPGTISIDALIRFVHDRR
jgi:putative oxidoreductase